MNSKHKGANSELIASVYLLNEGYEVFRNVSAHGPADLVAWNPETNETLYIDVKTATRYIRQDGSSNLAYSKSTVEGVKTLVVCDGVVEGYSQ